MNVSPLAGEVVNAVTVRVGVAALVLLVISVHWPRKAAVTVFLSNVTKRPLNWSATAPAGVNADVTMLVVLLPTSQVPITFPSTARLNAVSAVASSPIPLIFESIWFAAVNVNWSVFVLIALTSEAVNPVTLPTVPVTEAAIGVAAVAAVVTLVFMVAVRSPAVAAFVRFVTVVIVPAVIFVVLATVPVGNVAARKPVGCV